MQFLKLDYELITDTNITASEFRVFTYLLSRYNNEVKGAFPATQTIADKLNMGVATVKRSIKKLVELGYMIIEKSKGIKGNFNIYKKLKHLILDKQESKKQAPASQLDEQLNVNDVPTVKYNSYKNRTKKNKFTNYAQREYDYEQLAEDVLGW